MVYENHCSPLVLGSDAIVFTLDMMLQKVWKAWIWFGNQKPTRNRGKEEQAGWHLGCASIFSQAIGMNST
jgi:hypothetical protein